MIDGWMEMDGGGGWMETDGKMTMMTMMTMAIGDM